MTGTTIVNRGVTLCPRGEELSTDELIEKCADCEDFFLWCCPCSSKPNPSGRCCHHYRLVFTDGACSDNGQTYAKAGAGIAYGEDERAQYTIPITNNNDSHPTRTNQRAELFAAIRGLEILDELSALNDSDTERAPKRSRLSTTRRAPNGDEDSGLIVVTDSEYVVKGITEWFPSWRARGWRTASGKTPSNLDLFLELDSLATKIEKRGKYAVGFWHVRREFNQLADRLSKEAAVEGDIGLARVL